VQKNSYHDLQIIVVINEGRDGTKEWIECQKEIDYVYSRMNSGISYGLNIARSLIKSDYIICLSDYMYVLPGWDRELYREIEKIGTKSFLLSGTLIEPFESKEEGSIKRDYGSDFKSLDEGKLLKEYRELITGDIEGSVYPPFTIHIDLWDLVGGMSSATGEGISPYLDFSRKLHYAGVRTFRRKGSCLAYHFGSGKEADREAEEQEENTGRLSAIFSRFRTR
jgi:glycosyltransferase involved in cell wall biosynthesis